MVEVQKQELNQDQENLLNKLKLAAEKLYNDGELELADKLKEVISGISDQNYVLAVIIGKIQGVPNKVLKVIEQTFKVVRPY